MAWIKKLEVSFEDAGPNHSQDIWGQLEHIEWFYLMGLRETAKITYASIAHAFEDFG